MTIINNYKENNLISDNVYLTSTIYLIYNHKKQLILGEEKVIWGNLKGQ